MFKSIFGKMITIFLIVFLIGFSITGVILYIFLDDFVEEEKSRNLQEGGYNIANSFQLYLDAYLSAQSSEFGVLKNFFTRIAEENLNSSIQYYNNLARSIIWIVLEDGTIYIAYPGIPVHIQERMAGDNGNLMLYDENMYKEIMSGKNEVIIQKGDFYGFFKDPYYKDRPEAGDYWLTVQVPVRFVPEGTNEEIIAAVFLHTPFPEIQKARKDVFKFFLYAVLVASLIMTILVYFFSRRLTKPLKEINNAAKIISGGDFQKRLNIKSKDEIGELAGSFNQMVVALQNLEDMRRGFIANVSHELRTPMTTIRGFIEGILDGTIPPDRQNNYLTIVKDETDRLSRLVNDLLDLARMESGEMNLNFKSFDINELIRRCIIKMERLLIVKNIQVEATFEEEDLMVSADRDAIERVIINLVHNAIKFTPDNGRITVTTLVQRDKVLVSVEDNGPGISRDEIDRIWERFYKSDKSRSRDKSGTGLGLAIVRNIIGEHGEKIWVESEPGIGTKFIFTLDRA